MKQSNELDINSSTTNKSKAIMLGIVAIMILLVGLIVGYLLGSNKTAPSTTQENQQSYVSKATSPTTQPTVILDQNWKTYTSEDKHFSFDYPSNLVYDHLTSASGTVTFFANQQELNDSVSCVNKRQGTLQNPCISGLFDILDVTNFQSKKSIQPYIDSKDPLVENYIDTKQRTWVILGPVEGGGAYTGIAETKIGYKAYQIEFHFWYISRKDMPVEQQKPFLKQLLNTVHFED